MRASDEKLAIEWMRNRNKLLYISGTLPAQSETFVYREVIELEQLGYKVYLASVHTPESGLGSEQLDRMSRASLCIYCRGVAAFLSSLLKELLLCPRVSLSVAGLAMKDALTGDVGSMKRRPKILYQYLAGVYLAHNFRGRGVEHIHAHMAHVPTTIAMYAAKQLGVGFSFTGHAVDIFKERTLLPEKISRACFVACISDWHRQWYKKIVGKNKGNFILVRCGVDEDWLHVKKEKASRGRFEIVSVGRLVEKKGFDILLAAIDKIKQDYPEVHCTVVGDGPDREALESYVIEHGLTSYVSFVGAKRNAEIKRFLGSADLFALPCKTTTAGDRDGIPVVLMEAMAAEVCVVAGDLPAIRELVLEERTGYLVRPGSVESLVGVLSRIMAEKPGVIEMVAKAGREYVGAEFTTSRNARNLANAIETSLCGEC